MKKLLVLSALALALAFAGGTIANAQCYPARVSTVYHAPYVGYQHPHPRIVRQAYYRPAYYYGYRAYVARPRVVYGCGY